MFLFFISHVLHPLALTGGGGGGKNPTSQYTATVLAGDANKNTVNINRVMSACP